MLDHGARRENVGERGRNILVGDVHLLFQRIQGRVVEHLPPFAASGVVAWLRHFPDIGRAEFLEAGGNWRGRAAILRGEVAADQQGRAEEAPTQNV